MAQENVVAGVLDFIANLDPERREEELEFIAQIGYLYGVVGGDENELGKAVAVLKKMGRLDLLRKAGQDYTDALVRRAGRG